MLIVETNKKVELFPWTGEVQTVIWIANCINTFFVTEYVDMFPQTNGDILLQSILVWTGSQKLTSIRMYRPMSRLCACCQGKINKCQKVAYFWAFTVRMLQMGNQLLDEVIVTAQQRMSLRSGGR